MMVASEPSHSTELVLSRRSCATYLTTHCEVYLHTTQLRAAQAAATVNTTKALREGGKRHEKTGQVGDCLQRQQKQEQEPPRERSSAGGSRGAPVQPRALRRAEGAAAEAPAVVAGGRAPKVVAARAGVPAESSLG